MDMVFFNVDGSFFAGEVFFMEYKVIIARRGKNTAQGGSGVDEVFVFGPVRGNVAEVEYVGAAEHCGSFIESAPADGFAYTGRAYGSAVFGQGFDNVGGDPFVGIELQNCRGIGVLVMAAAEIAADGEETHFAVFPQQAEKIRPAHAPKRIC